MMKAATPPQRWHFVNAKNIREQTGNGALGSAFTLTNQAYDFPTGVIGKNGNQSGELSWQPVQGATSYNIRYSLMNGGPYEILAANTTSTDYVANGLTNGQTYYFVVTAIESGTERTTSEQVPISPFDTTQNIALAGTASEGEQLRFVTDIDSNAPAAGNPSYIDSEYLESPGPILYKQLRSGRNGRLFNIIKIRSMHINAETHGKPKWAEENDKRRLRVGTFMRKWNIDEMPQFWNVLTGEMSLVGPRPERPELIARFKSKFPHYQARHMCRPGITGWAQVNGWRGNTDLQERIRHDIWYLENWNIWLDFRIMAQTFLRQKNAY
jgi:lipopolysaccharide/colanic/teichoic acid biosynthesis glycosyltransferase